MATLRTLSNMNKTDLVEIADILEIPMPRMGTKDVVVDAIRTYLVNLKKSKPAPVFTASPAASSSLLHQRADDAAGVSVGGGFVTAEEGSDDDEGVEIREAVPEIFYLTVLGARSEMVIPATSLTIVEDVKKAIGVQMPIPTKLMSLVYNRVEMRNSHMLRDYQISADAEIELILKARGGAECKQKPDPKKHRYQDIVVKEIIKKKSEVKESHQAARIAYQALNLMSSAPSPRRPSTS